MSLAGCREQAESICKEEKRGRAEQAEEEKGSLSNSPRCDSKDLGLKAAGAGVGWLSVDLCESLSRR